MAGVTAGVSEIIEELAAAVAAAQYRLDEQARLDREDFVRVLRIADSLGLRTVAARLAPSAYSIDTATCECQVHVQRTRESGWSLRVSPLSLGFARKYGSTVTASHTLTVLIARVHANDAAVSPR